MPVSCVHSPHFSPFTPSSCARRKGIWTDLPLEMSLRLSQTHLVRSRARSKNSPQNWSTQFFLLAEENALTLHTLSKTWNSATSINPSLFCLYFEPRSIHTSAEHGLNSPRCDTRRFANDVRFICSGQ